MSVAYNLVFETVVLGVYAASQDQNSIRKLCVVVFTAAQHFVVVHDCSAVLPQLSEESVADYFEPFRIPLSIQELDDDLAPWSPWRSEGR